MELLSDITAMHAEGEHVALSKEAFVQLTQAGVAAVPTGSASGQWGARVQRHVARHKACIHA